MSHSKIIQLSGSPVAKEEYIEESMYYDGFVGSVADYISDETDREEDIEWLAENLKGAAEISKDPLSRETITVKDKVAYFSPKYTSWISKIGELRLTDLESFAGKGKGKYKLDSDMDWLNDLYNDRHNIYIDCGGLQTLDSFMRRAANGATYYIGGTVDYHY